MKVQRSSGAILLGSPSPRQPRLAVLVLHGGSADSTAAVGRWSLAALLLVPVAGSIARSVPGAAVYRLRNSVRGWNGDGAAVLGDARWALHRIGAAHPGVPVLVVGHSLGGRVAAHLAGEGTAAGGVGLAPWLNPGDPVTGLQGVPFAVVQGTRDRVIPTPTTELWLAAAASAGALIRRSVVDGGAHSMLWRFRRWRRFCVESVEWVDRAAAGSGDAPSRWPGRRTLTGW